MKKLTYLLILSLITYPLLLIHAQDIKSLADSNNAFAFDLYSQIKTKDGSNLFFSPFSISSALAMTYAGARTETEKQMSNTLHYSLDQKNFHSNFKTLLEKIDSDNVKGLQIDVANSLWAQKDYKFLPEFFDLVKSNYHSELQKVNYKEKTEREIARNTINTWVEQKTNNKIRDLIPPDLLTKDTRLILVNAIYFNGKWVKEFDKNLTREDFFNTSSTEKLKTFFMHSKEDYNYFQDDAIKAVEIPYKDKKASMLVILPNDINNLKAVETSLTNSYYNKIISSLVPEDVQLSLPKFKTTSQFRLGDALIKMGMPIAFSDAADFSGMADSLKISEVIHKAFVDVSESGTEAAAATAVIMTVDSAVEPPPKVFNANHPFIFIIKDTATGSILFMGEINNPTIH